MTIKELQSQYARSTKIRALSDKLNDKDIDSLQICGLTGSAVAMAFASASEGTDMKFLFIMQDVDEAGYLQHDLQQLCGNDNVLFFPSSFRRAVKYGQRDAANEILRTETLARLSQTTAAASPLFIITYPQALAELVVSQQQLNDNIIKLHQGQSFDIEELEKRLFNLGFTNADYVYEPGQFAIRGSIVDVYSYTSELPFRIDFFGDEIDTIRTFDVQDQLSREKKLSIEIVPELALSKSAKVPMTEFLADDTIVVSKDMLFIRSEIERVYNEGFSTQAIADRMKGVTEMEQQQILQSLQRESALATPTTMMMALDRFRKVSLHMSQMGNSRSKACITYDTVPQPLFHKNIDLMKSVLADYRLKGYRIYLLAESTKQHDRLHELLGDELTFTPISNVLHDGFVDNVTKQCVFTDHQIFDRFHKYNLKSDKARHGKMAITMKELQELQPGDYIVHVDFGIGKFGGLVRVPTPNGQSQEMIRIVYQRGDLVDVSIHSLYKISKYRSSDSGEAPRLSTLGTGAWDRLKERTKKRIKDIARDLIKLYAKRRHEKGFAFTPDTYLQQELEASFLYEDTPDQMKATQEVKADMESSRPMDRLVCGDVGFGKTEVAIRAAFKAACDSKQVAVLVPTTVLAFQHYKTFESRLRNMPVKVEYLSRARSPKKTKEILEELEQGRIDIIIGTHKLISKSVKWHDLGLLIIDEEQKFGVAVKEKLRQLRTNIDTLTMSATPIPRTLQFSLMGARDMSIMRTPPPNRYPIYTEWASYGHEVICEAINFEMARNGQVFFVNDRISNLPDIAAMIRQHIPDCRIAIGHGQMAPETLEKIVMGFINYDYDVLLSTTIVENGVDIANANTIIINDAHHFGLSDLHQMRGRVGRSNKKAFCYLLAPPRSALTNEARRRLEALETFSELGSGFALAMQDLDIRGAGNLLGSEQSGFMEDLGYETYQKILAQAVTELKNEEFQELYDPSQGEDYTNVTGDEFVDDCSVESDLQMYFPETYVPGAAERMLLYRELDNIEDDRALDAYRQRLIDRFGPVPPQGEELMQIVLLRRIGRALGVEKITLRQGIMILQLVSASQSAYYQSAIFGKVLDYAVSNIKRCVLKEVKGRRVLQVNSIQTAKEAVETLKEM